MRRPLLALVLAVLALAPACQVDDQPEPDDRTRGERCDDMQMCGRTHCLQEMSAIVSCNIDVEPAGCDHIRDIWGPLYADLADCLESNGCVEVSCDMDAALGASVGDPPDEYPRIDFDSNCDVAEDAELADKAIAAMFVEDNIAECQALE